ncbi:MAG: type IV pilin-like G/H family protein [Cyanobacteria bacterium P01_C01_bin.118]
MPAMFQCLANKPESQKIEGFTLIEMLVTISIIGMLSAIAVPSFMGQVNKAKETEAKIAMNTLKKNQQFFYLENSRFADEIGQLNFYKTDRNPSTEKEIETEYYSYSVQRHPRLNGRLHLAFSRKKGMKSYASVVHLKDEQLEECGLFSLNISQEHPGLEILRFIFEAIENYEQYCS